LKRWVAHGLDFAERGIVKSKNKKINVIVKEKK
jgi:hypothetical protein